MKRMFNHRSVAGGMLALGLGCAVMGMPLGLIGCEKDEAKSKTTTTKTTETPEGTKQTTETTEKTVTVEKKK